MMIHQLSEKEKREVEKRFEAQLAKRKEIIFAYIYGSFLTAAWFRDLDIAVFVNEKKVAKKEVIDYEISLSLELEKMLQVPFDAKILNYAPLSFRYEVTKGKVVFCRDEEAMFRFREITWQRYLDFSPVEEEFIREMF